MTLPRVTIVMTTYFPDGEPGRTRLGAVRRALNSWHRNLQYEGEVAMHVADDGSEAGFANDFLGELASVPGISTTRQERHGVGASLNAGFDVAERDGGIVAMFVDDWELLAPLDITPWVQLLLDDATVGMVRLGPPHPWLTGRVEAFPSGWGLRLERHHYAFGHRPALYHPRMREAYGPFDEDVNAYDCERLYAERWCAAWRRPIDGEEVPAPGEPPGIVLALPTLWEHIDSVELAGVDPRA